MKDFELELEIQERAYSGNPITENMFQYLTDKYVVKCINISNGTKTVTTCNHHSENTPFDVVVIVSGDNSLIEIAEWNLNRECIVKGCTNKSSEGRFIGKLCSPCHNMITNGKPEIRSSNFIHRLFLNKETDNGEIKKIKAEGYTKIFVSRGINDANIFINDFDKNFGGTDD